MLHDRMLPIVTCPSQLWQSDYLYGLHNSGCVKHIILPPRMGVMVNLLNVFGSNVSIYLGSG